MISDSTRIRVSLIIGYFDTGGCDIVVILARSEVVGRGASIVQWKR